MFFGKTRAVCRCDGVAGTLPRVSPHDVKSAWWLRHCWVPFGPRRGRDTCEPPSIGCTGKQHVSLRPHQVLPVSDDRLLHSPGLAVLSPQTCSLLACSCRCSFIGHRTNLRSSPSRNMFSGDIRKWDQKKTCFKEHVPP